MQTSCNQSRATSLPRNEDFLLFMNQHLLKVLTEIQILGTYFNWKGFKGFFYLLSQSEGTAKLLPITVARPHLHSGVNNLHTK